MKMYDLITKKKLGQVLSKDEIEFMVQGYSDNEIPDYQMSAMLMAIYFKGMNEQEATDLTLEMVSSGEVLTIDDDYLVDKHSTGGVADTTSLIVVPILAAAGCKVAKMSGRGLGHTGGTIDKLESFHGFNTEISNEKFLKQLGEIGVAIIGQTKNLAPVDKKIYALRDVTATVNSIPLIASSIMAKKLASGAKTIILDVKCGKGAFMSTLDEARELAYTMFKIGKRANRNMVAIISDMNHPLGMAIGNTLEVIDSIKVLDGKYVPRLSELCETIVVKTLVACKKAKNYNEAKDIYQNILTTKKGLDKFKELIIAQGGDGSYFEDFSKFDKALFESNILADKSGYIANIDALSLGKVAMDLGAGRVKKDDVIDLAAGIILKYHINEKVKKGEILATLYSNRTIDKRLIDKMKESISISKSKNSEELIYEIIK